MIKLAVIGDPIEHSLSPHVHGAALSALGIDHTYDKIRVTPEGLGDFAEYAKENLDGFNLTMPHKEKILPYLAHIDSEAEYYSAVNTACVRHGELYGFNTDGKGFSFSLERMNTGFSGNNITVLGAGGAASAVIAAAAAGNAKLITISCRTAAKAEQIRAHLGDKNPEYAKKIRICGFDNDTLSNACETSDILINATPLGMEGVSHNFDSLEFLDALPPKSIVCDLIYKPKRTDFLSAAEYRNHPVSNGLDMLIFQALAADEKYLEKRLDFQTLYKAVISKL